MDGLTQDLRYTLRRLARSKAFAAGVIVTLSLGIGVNSAMFGVLDVLMLRPPAYVQEATRIARVYVSLEGGARLATRVSFPAYESLLGVRAFRWVAAVASGRVSIGFGSGARRADVCAVTASLFPLLGARPERGRFFDSTDDRLGAGPVAVISHRYWAREMAADPSAVGRTIKIGEFLYSVVGVAPSGFTGADLVEPDLWLPIRQSAPLLSSALALSTSYWDWVSVLGRLAPGISMRAAAAPATLAYRRSVPALVARDSTMAVRLGPIWAARGPGFAGDAKVSLWVEIVALVVLLVACANVANLFLERSLRRRSEFAVRAALGASTARLVRESAIECLVLALAGGLGGVLVAWWGGAVLRAYLLPQALPSLAPLDARVLAFTGLGAVATGLLVGILHAWRSRHVDLGSALRGGGRSVNALPGGGRWKLLSVDVALCTVLLVGTGLFVRSLRHARTLDYGLDLDRVLEASVDLEGSTPGNVVTLRQDPRGGPLDAQSALYVRLERRARLIPEVMSVAVSAGTPYRSSFGQRLRVSGQEALPRVSGGGPFVMAVSPGYFTTAGTRILRGRAFTDSDVKGVPPVTIVGATFAHGVGPDRDPLGQCVFLGGRADSTCVTVVGVAADARLRRVTDAEALMYYVPVAQMLVPWPVDGLLMRTRGPARPAAAALQHVLQRVEPDLPFVSVTTLAELVEPQWRSWEMGATMFAVLALLALVVAAVGVYSVTAYSVGQRCHEFGVRVALGARRADIVRLAVLEAARAAVVGCAGGLLVALGVGRALSSLLFGVAPVDPPSIAVAILVLLLVATVAAWLPGWRAALIDPTEALHHE